MLGCQRVEGHGKIWWNKEYEVSGVNWGKLSKASPFRFLSVSLSFKRQDAHFLQYRDGISHMRNLRPASGVGKKVLPAPAVSHIPSA